MRIDIITVLPEILNGPLDHSIIKRARDKGLAEIYIHNLRDYSDDKHRRVDDYSYSKGAGMVMAIRPIEKAVNSLKKERHYDEIIFTTPDG
ncbi:MAG: tRNA (guanosine(37)-N1)-methyltransferase TrmD, partial [Prolixibacteraceae bacterium]|nr:tRNA (guanosine(37)-N1)-methyltransferase TrmD [Prolixibacteraceae bacterium]